MQVNNEKLKEDEHERKFQVFTLKEQPCNQEKSHVKLAMNEMKHLFGQWKSWVEAQKDNEELQSKIEMVKQETDVLLKKATKNVKAFCDNEDVKEMFHTGKDKVVTTSMNAAHLVSEGIQEALQQENVKKVMDNIHHSIEQVRNDERVKTNVKKLKRGTLHIVENAYQGIKKRLEDQDVEKGTTDDFHQ